MFGDNKSLVKIVSVFPGLSILQWCRYAFQIVLQTREMLRALPSLVDINVPHGKHFTVCGDVHGQVIFLYISFLNLKNWHSLNLSIMQKYWWHARWLLYDENAHILNVISCRGISLSCVKTTSQS